MVRHAVYKPVLAFSACTVSRAKQRSRLSPLSPEYPPVHSLPGPQECVQPYQSPPPWLSQPPRSLLKYFGLSAAAQNQYHSPWAAVILAFLDCFLQGWQLLSTVPPREGAFLWSSKLDQHPPAAARLLVFMLPHPFGEMGAARLTWHRFPPLSTKVK